MAFFLVDRNRDDGSLRLLSANPFPTREDALTALPGLMASHDSGSHDVFVCDLDTATPVLFVPQPPSPTEVIASAPDQSQIEEPLTLEAEPTAGVWETPAPAEAELETALTDEAAEGMELADALRRAATSMESEGIVAPEPILPVPVVEEPVTDKVDDEVTETEAPLLTDAEDSDEVAIDEAAEESVAGLPTFEEDLASTIASLGVEIPVEEAATPDKPAETTATTEWPWANVEPVDDVETLTQPEEAALAAGPLEEEFVPRPVIMGDYGDTAISEDTAEVAPVEEVPEPEPVVEPIEAQTVETEPVEIPVPTLAEELAAVETAPAAYEPGELELGEYSCDDCVYANTCPKAGTSNPAECGSFQWKSL
jgi:hypothetical protein